MKKQDGNQFDEIIGDTHAYTYLLPDPNQGSIADGFLTTRMKNTAFVPSSAV